MNFSMSSNCLSLSGVVCFCDCYLALHVKWFDAIILLESVNNVVLPLFDVHVQPIENGDCAFLEVVQQNNKMATAKCRSEKVCCAVSYTHLTLPTKA